MPQLDAIQSAETVAALRALAGSEAGLVTPCRDLFARHFLSLKNRLLLTFAPQGLLRSVIERMSPGSYCFTIARTRHFDEALLACFDWPATPLAFELVKEGVALDEAAFREFAGTKRNVSR